jgi:eukaryotic-like serine/threonine-protein kinase
MTNKIILTISGQGQPQIITYDRPIIFTIGSDPTCQIHLTNANISGQHCQLEINPPQITIKDLQSTFGTAINRISLAQITLASHQDYILNAGDKIILSRGTITITVDVEINGKSLTHQVVPFQVSPGQNNTPIKKLNFWQTIQNFLGLNNDNLSSTNIPGYRIIDKIAETKLSEIYLANHIQTQTEVVLKVMSSEIQSDVKKRDIFFREFENTRALDHPNIVKFKHQGWAENLFFFTLEYCDQGSVYDIIQKRKRPFSPQESINITLQILEGLIYAQQKP